MLMGPQSSACLAVLRRDLQIRISYRLGFFTQWLGAFFSLTLFYYISRLVHIRPFASADAYYAFAVVGLIILQILNSTLHSPPGLVRQELVAGTLERIVLSPFGPVATLTSMLVFPFLNALINGMVMLAFASLVFGVQVRWATAPLVPPLALLGGLAFAPFGLMLMAIVLLVKQAVAGTTWVVAGISLIAGLYFPVALLPGWIRWAAEVQPFTSSVELLRNVLVGAPLRDPAWLDLTRMAAFALVLMPLAWLALRAAIQMSRRRATIIEY
jgi:ABC-2 type transport system permease protein